MRLTHKAGRLAVAIAAAGTLGPMAVTPALATSRPAPTAPAVVAASQEWEVTAATTTDPLASPAGPATGAVALPPSGCHPAADGPAAGEGIVSVTMAGPGTDWSSEADTAVTADVAVDDRPAQVVVLFGGAQPFRYQGFVGALSTGVHCVRVTVRPDLSHTTTVAPSVRVYAVSLAVVTPGSSDFLLETHDPVLYGRSTSAVGDTPLITYGQQSPDPDGVDTDLSYTVTWTHEDVGDGIVPAYEWGLWGRMTDVETVLDEKVAPDGTVLAATYLSCGCEGFPVYPDIVPEFPAAGGETDKPYPPASSSGVSPGLDRHLGLRDATGNNDISPYGTSPYRFQQTLVTAPGPGQMRELAEDANPWTYRISNDEIVRETAQSSDPDDFLAGTYPQYLIVDIDSRPTGTGSVSVTVQLDGGKWYSDDYSQMTAPGPASTFPFYNGGHGRTVIKLPVGWHTSTVTGLRLTLNASAPGTTPRLPQAPTIQLIEVTPQYGIANRPVPAAQVIDGTQLVPAQLGH